MSFRRPIAVVVVLVATLIIAGVWLRAQGRGVGPGPSSDLITESPTVVSGENIGFRLERTQDGIAIGTLVVRVDGRWVDTDLRISAIPSR
jgi:hypothetical protein